MDLFKIGFLTIRLIDIIDVAIVAFLLYKLYSLLRGGVAINIFIGLLSVYTLYLVFVKVLKMQLLGTILGQFMSLGFIALIIVFQQEVRRFLIVLGTNSFLTRNAYTRQLLPWNWQFQKSGGLYENATQVYYDRCGISRLIRLLYQAQAHGNYIQCSWKNHFGGILSHRKRPSALRWIGAFTARPWAR